MRSVCSLRRVAMVLLGRARAAYTRLLYLAREHSELLDAQDELAEIRNEVYVNILNARDIMRAALRTIDRLEELDAVIPPLADLIGVQS